MSLAACISHCPSTTRRPWLRKRLAAGVGLEHRGLRFLRLQEQWVAIVAAGEEDDPGAGPDAADADDLVGQVAELVALEQVGAVPLQGVRVFLQDLADHRLEVVVGGALELLDRARSAAAC